jgi:hypothetical protein
MSTKTRLTCDAAEASKLTTAKAVSSFSIKDLREAKISYSQVLGIKIAETPEGLGLRPAGSVRIFAYPKSNHVPATFTVLNVLVDDIEETWMPSRRAASIRTVQRRATQYRRQWEFLAGQVRQLHGSKIPRATFSP